MGSKNQLRVPLHELPSDAREVLRVWVTMDADVLCRLELFPPHTDEQDPAVWGSILARVAIQLCKEYSTRLIPLTPETPVVTPQMACNRMMQRMIDMLHEPDIFGPRAKDEE